ncbi:M14 family metallopeptidase [Chitinophaga barathri]|uniref:Zinc carboxypeptidase n=1 Tax=Chitinophaga barathri TaxID=1647451 RepID=A0A3N4M562_9BACT|nr:M14 family metallopeptidase [Chitinophaga barathri]RPD38341.1 zinc carboxypeptidase [Chitinophaga barathri]
MRYIFLFLAILAAIPTSQAQPSPQTFLQYQPGARFTPHFKVMEYFRQVAEASKNVKLETYGETYEGRPLVMAILSSPENMARLEDIRKHNLGLVSGSAQGAQPVIIWLSYNVHGNEAVSTEAAMKTLYTLLTERQELLKNAVVIIDPCLNPDGRERYVNFYNSIHSKQPDATPYAREHYEPWPGGRSNHYYFDLNRDWAWQTQTESRQRVLQYNRWMPQVHVDFHEQGVDAPYYFAPAAEPLHDAITEWQRAFQVQIGKHNATYFDAKGWLYFTREQFDLFYPSYGDTYPTYNGSIGMTYEQGGGGRAGLAITTRQGDTLTLKDRVEHHFITGMATLEVSAANADKLVKEFTGYFADARSKPSGDYKTYVVKGAGNAEKLLSLSETLRRNDIVTGFATGSSAGTGFNYFTGKTEKFNIEKGDLVVSAYQPRSNLVRVLFEPVARLTDSVTYDITAWALPYAYGLPAYAVTAKIDPPVSAEPEKTVVVPAEGNTYAYLAPWNSTKDLKFLAALLNRNIKVRYSEAPFTIGEKTYPAGTLIMTKAGNPSLDAVPAIAAKMEVSLVKVPTGFVDKGADFGSDKIRFIRKPKVAVVAGDGVSSLSMGEIWHFFEQQIDYPLTVIPSSSLASASWRDLDVLILPDGNYSALADKQTAERLKDWVKAGGRLIALEDAVGQLAQGEWGFSLKKEEEENKDKKEEEKKDPYLPLKPYENRERESVSQFIPGAIYKVHLDKTHPLAFGYPEYYYTLKQSDKLVQFIESDGWNVGVLKQNDYLTGFVGAQTKLRLNNGMLFGVKEMGQGEVVLLTDNPLFRSFWENGKLMFGNAVFMVGQ